MEKVTAYLTLSTVQKSEVRVWKETIFLPTYLPGKPEKNPVFLEKRVYQGSSGVVYPYPVIESIAIEKTDVPYEAVFIENEYLKIMILPQLGGRVHMAWDKLKQRHFVYYNQVVKPALVGLAGPWISGGIEFNWPQHHRPSTFMSVDYMFEKNPDGSATVWIHEMERMSDQRATVGFTLYPGKAYLEIKGRLFNRSVLPQTFLWWANPAVSVNEEYQSVFPPDVHAVFDHGKRDVSTFPVAMGTYYKVDYSSGVDISRYKNIPVPTSYMAIHSDYDFVGGYEHDTQAGLLHVANHHICPGKKQWTWGCGDFGRAWDRNLTDEDGPYIELMTGVFTDNQPDFSWLQPFEEKEFQQYFMPYRELGMVKNASKDVMINLEPEGDSARFKVFATSRFEKSRVVVRCFGKIILEQTACLCPEHVLCDSVLLGSTSFEDITLEVFHNDGRLMLAWSPGETGDASIPEPAKPPLLPQDERTTEQLFLTGQHLEQYRHATYAPTDYYLEALCRDPGDMRNNNAMGLWLIRRAKFGEAEPYLRKAIQTITQRNPNPYDGEPYYNLGVALCGQREWDEAYAAFYKATWNASWQGVAFYSLARISSRRQRWDDALYEVEQALIRNNHQHGARHLKVAVLRHMGRTDEALTFADNSLVIDPFNYGCRFEKYLMTHESSVLEELHYLMRDNPHNFIQITRDYLKAGLFCEGIQLLGECLSRSGCSTPMVYYTLGHLHHEAGGAFEALIAFKRAAESPSDFCFPNQPDDALTLQKALEVLPTDAKAWYYLGNYWYDKRQYNDAVVCWERSRDIDDTFPTVWRNLALAYFNKLRKPEQAKEYMERAFAQDPSDARILMELDQLYKKLGVSHQVRLDLLDKYPALVLARDDLYLERVTLLNQLKRFLEAIERIAQRTFHPWEGGEGKVPAQYQYAYLELARQSLFGEHFSEALSLLEEGMKYPDHLGEGRLYGAQENDFYYYLGCAYQGLDHSETAQSCFERASGGLSEPTAAIFYNDQKPDKIFYQGMALRKLGREEEAEQRFRRLISYGEEHLNDTIRVDYFAVSLPDLLIWEDDLDVRNVIHCHYLMGLGYLGLGDRERAMSHLNKVREMDVNHQGVRD